MTVPNAGDLGVRVVPDFSTFANELGMGLDAAVQVAKNETRNAFAELFRSALSAAVFDPLKKQAGRQFQQIGISLAQDFANAFTRGMIEQFPGKLGRTIQTSMMQGGTSAAEAAGGMLATRITNAVSQTLGTRLGEAAAKGLVGLYKAFTGAADRVKQVWSQVVGWLDNTGVLAGMRKAGTSVGNALMSAWQSAVERIRDVGPKLLDWGRQFGERLIAGLQRGWGNIRPYFQAAIEKIREVGRDLVPIGKLIGEKVLDGMRSAWTHLEPLAKALMTGLANAFGGATASLTNAVQTVAQRIGESLRGALANRMRDAAGTAGLALTDQLKVSGGEGAAGAGRSIVGRLVSGIQTTIAQTQAGPQIAQQVFGPMPAAAAKSTYDTIEELDRLIEGAKDQQIALMAAYAEVLSREADMPAEEFQRLTDIHQREMAALDAQIRAWQDQQEAGWDDHISSISGGWRAAWDEIRENMAAQPTFFQQIVGTIAMQFAILGDAIYKRLETAGNAIGRMFGRLLPEHMRTAATESLSTLNTAFRPLLSGAIGTAAGLAIGYALVRGLYATLSKVVGWATEVYKLVGQGLLKVGEYGLKAGAAIVRGLGSALQGVAGVVADAVGLIGRGLAGVGSMVANAAGAAAAAVAGIGAAAVKAGKDYNVLYQTSIVSFRTILGTREAATQMMEDLAAFARTSPFPRQAFIEATRTMLSFGYEAKQVIPTLDAIQNAAAATGRGAEDISEIVRIFSQVQSTGRLSAITLNQLGIRGINAAKMIADGMGMAEGEIRDALRKGTIDGREALEALTQQMAKTYAGAAAGVKETWDGAVDRIKGATRDIGSILVEPFISREGGGMAVEWANKLADLLRALETHVEPLVTAFVEHLGPALGEITPMFERITETIKGLNTDRLADSFARLGPIIAAAGSAAAVFAGKNLFSGIPIIGDFVGKLNPLVVGLGALVALSPDLQAGIMEVVRGPLAQMTDLFGRMAPLLELLSTTFKEVLLDAVIAIVPVFRTLLEQVVQLAPIFINMFREVSAAFGPLATILGQTLARILESWGPALGAVMNAIAALAGPLGQVIGVFARSFGGLLETLGPAFGRIAGSIAGTLGNLLPAVQPIIGVLGRLLSGMVAQMAPIIAQIVPIIGRVLQAVMPIIGQVLGALGRVFNALLPVLMPVIRAISGALLDAFTALQPALDALLPIFVDLARTVFPILAEVIAQLAPVLPTIAQAFGDLAVMVGTLFADAIKALAPLLPTLAGFFAQLAEKVLPLLVRVLEPLLEPFQQLIPVIAELVVALLPPLMDIFDALVPIIIMAADVVGSIGSAAIELAKALVPIVRALLPALVPLFEILLQILTPLMPLINLLVGMLSTTLVIAIRVLTIPIGILATLFTGIFRVISLLLRPIQWLIVYLNRGLTVAFREVGGVLGPLARFFGSLAGIVGGALVTAFRFAQRIFNAILTPIKALWRWIVGGSPGLVPAFQLLRDIVRRIMGAVRRVIETVWNRGIRPVFDALRTAVDAVGGAFRWLYDRAIRPVWRLIRVAFERGGDVVGAIFGGIKAGIDAIGGAFRWLKDRIAWVWDKIRSGISVVWDKIRPIFEAFKGFADIIRRAFATMRDKLGSIFEKVKEVIKKPIAWVVNNVINKIIGGINALITKIGIPAIPKIPGFARGGKLPGYGGGDIVPAMLEPGETVVPKWGQRDPAFAAWAHRRGIPGYYQGGLVGAENGPNNITTPSPRFSLPGWANPVEWGKGVVKGAGGIWRLGKNIVAEGGKLLRYAAAKAFEVLVSPLARMMKPFADSDNLWRQWMGKTVLDVIEKAKAFIWGKSEDTPVTEGGALAAEVIRWAKTRIGMPYVWAAKGPNKFDCSGLVQWSYAKAGIPGIGPDTYQQVKKGRAVKGPPQLADLLFWGRPQPHHVALALGGGRMIEAQQSGVPVGIFPVRKGWYARRIIEAAMVPGGTGTGRWASVIAQALRIVGYPTRGSLSDAIGAIQYIMAGESSGNPRAINKRDVNWRNGNPSIGLMQLTMSNMRHYVPNILRGRMNQLGTSHWSSAGYYDPLIQLTSAIRYMQSRYGGVMNAQRVWARQRWYDEGGWLPTGASTVINNTGRPEPVLSTSQWDTMRAAAGAASGPMRITGGSLAIEPDSQGRLQAWVQDLILEEDAMAGTRRRMGGGRW